MASEFEKLFLEEDLPKHGKIVTVSYHMFTSSPRRHLGYFSMIDVTQQLIMREVIMLS
jgi:hypothetical protein